MKVFKEQSENTVKINYITYELNDSILLLNCIIKRKNKTYFSNIPIDLLHFTQLMLKQKNHSIVLEKISESLFNKQIFINHVCPSSLLKKELIVSFNDLYLLSNQVRISA